MKESNVQLTLQAGVPVDFSRFNKKIANNERSLATKQEFAELTQHSGIAINDTKLRELDGGERKYHRLGGKVTTIKEEFKQQDSKVNSIFVFTVFYIIVIAKKKREILRVIMVLPDVPDVREPI